LAEIVPLWRTVAEDGVTALITQALDYVGGLELARRQARSSREELLLKGGMLLSMLDLSFLRMSNDADPEI